MGGQADRAAHRFLLVSLWVSATVIAAVITWTALARLGQEASAGDQPTLTQSEVRRELAQVVTPSPSTSAGPSTSPTTTTRTTPSTPRDPSTSTGSVPREYRSWTVAGGRVSASCAGSVIKLEPTNPFDGWVMEVDDTGPDKIRVEFSRGDSDSRVEAFCSGGVPVLKSDGDG